MIDRNTFDLIKQRHAGYASWAVWAEPTDKPKANIGDLRVLDPDENPALLETLRNDVIMVGLNFSRPVLPEPFRNFHDPRPQSQDYKIRDAFAGTPYYGAYMTDVIKDVVEVDSRSLMGDLLAKPSVVTENVDRLLAELTDLKCDRPSIVAFGGDAHWVIEKHVPPGTYSRLVKVTHYSYRMKKGEYRQRVSAEMSLPSR